MFFTNCQPATWNWRGKKSGDWRIKMFENRSPFGWLVFVQVFNRPIFDSQTNFINTNWPRKALFSRLKRIGNISDWAYLFGMVTAKSPISLIQIRRSNPDGTPEVVGWWRANLDSLLLSFEKFSVNLPMLSGSWEWGVGGETEIGEAV